MKLTTALLPLAAITSAFVLPDEQLTNQILLESHKEPSFVEKLQGNVEDVWAGAEEAFKGAVAFSENALTHGFDRSSEAVEQAVSTFECSMSMTKFDMQGWLDSTPEIPEGLDILEEPKPPHKKPHKKPHHSRPPHHGKSNKTIYELISGSKYTTKLAKLINEYDDLVKILNGTAANYTLFAPTDKAFESLEKKLPKGHKKPSKELIKKVLAYHLSPEFYPAGRILSTHTIPTALAEDHLGGEPQRLRVGFGLLTGIRLNFYSKVVAVNIFGSNGVIHGVDSILLPPPPAAKLLSLLPSEFSTFLLALERAGFASSIASTHATGATLFVPNNFAFKKLGRKVNAFLFSRAGVKYLQALIQYHTVVNETLYSDAFYKTKSVVESMDFEEDDVPKGQFHVDLPTLLGDKSLGIDIARYGGLIIIKINGYTRVTTQDGVAKDGVIHVLSSVLIPPKTPGGVVLDGEEVDMDLEDFKARLIPHLEEEL